VNVRARRSVLAVLTAVAVLAGAGVGVGLAVARSRGDAAVARARSQAAVAGQRRSAVLSGRLAALAVAAIRTNPGLAQLLAVAATRVDNTPQARAALSRAATVPASPERVLRAGGGGGITALAVAADGGAVVAGTSDGEVTEFNLRTGATIQETVASDGAAILGVAVSATGTTAVAAYGLGAVLLRPGHPPVSLKVRGHPFSVGLSPSGQRVAVLSTLSGPLVTTDDGKVMPELLTVLSPQRGTRATTTSLESAGWTGGFVLPREPDLFSDEYFTELAFPSESVLTLTPVPGAFIDYAPSDLKVIARSSPAPGTDMMEGNSANGAFYGMEDAADALDEWPATAAAAGQLTGSGLSAQPTDLAFSDDGKFAAAVVGDAIVVNPLSSAADDPLAGTQLTASPGTSGVAFAGEDRVVSVSGSTIQLWDLGTAVHLSSVTNDCCGSVSELTVSPDGRYVITDDSIFSNAAGLPVAAGIGSSDGGDASPDGGTISEVWSDGQPLDVGLDIGRDHVIVLNPESALNPGSALSNIENPDGIVLGSWPVPTNEPSVLFAASATTDGGIVIVRGGTSPAVITVNPRTSKASDRTIPVSGVTVPGGTELAPLAISQDGEGAVFAEFATPAQPDQYGQPAQPVLSGSLVYENLVTGAARVLTSDGVPGGGAVLFTRDLLLVQTADGSVQEWDTSAGRLLRTLPLAGIGTIGLTASPDGTLLAAVNSATGVASVADAETGQVIATLPLPPAPEGKTAGTWTGTIMAISPDDRYLFTATPGGALTRWDIGESDLIRLACRRAGDNLTPAIWRQYVHTPPPADLSCLGPPGRR